jgi:tRNA threonylcarbamoyl adenosine modification protein YeaZ
MLTLCLDTSHKYLVIGLIKDDVIISNFMQESWKRQSETIIPEIDRALKTLELSPKDIDQIVITKGPGSFTGVRIAMTIAKLLGSLTTIEIFTISTLQLYAGDHNALVLLDARGGRAYCGRYTNYIGDEMILKLDNIQELINEDTLIIGDGKLIDYEDYYPDIVNNFLICKPYWLKVDNIDLLKPIYFKETSEYKPNI